MFPPRGHRQNVRDIIKKRIGRHVNLPLRHQLRTRINFPNSRATHTGIKDKLKQTVGKGGAEGNLFFSEKRTQPFATQKDIIEVEPSSEKI